MSKNLIRKGLAFSAVVALGITGISALPSSAAGQADTSFVSLVPTAGTEYTVLTGDTFKLKSNQATAVTGTGKNLKWLVAGDYTVVAPSAVASAVAVDDWARASTTITITDAGHGVVVGDVLVVSGMVSGAGTYATEQVTVLTVPDANTFTYTTVNGSGNINGTAATGTYHRVNVSASSYVVDSLTATNTSDKQLWLANSGASTVSVVVTAWVDDNDNDTIDSTEYASPERTVKFLKASELTGAVTYDTVVLGDNVIDAYVTTTPALNGDLSTTDDVEVGFTYQGVSGTDVNNATFNSTSRKYEASSDGITVIAGSYSVTPYFNGTAIGSKVTIALGAAVADDAEGLASETSNINVFDSGTDDLELDIRSETLSATVTYQVVDEDGNAVGAGKSVRANASDDGGTLPTGAKLNGTTIVDGADVVFTTDSKGQVVFTITATAAPEGRYVYLTVEAEGNSDTYVDFEFSWEDADYEIFETTNSGTDDYWSFPYSDFARAIAVGGSYSFSIAYLDQWAQAPSGSYRAYVETYDRTISAKAHTMSNGRVSFTVSDDQLGSSDSLEVYVQIEKLTGSTWGDAGGYDDESWYLWPYAQSNGAVTPTSDLVSDIADSELVAGDNRSSQGENIGYETDYDDSAYFEGNVTDATDGTPKEGAKVTISGPSNILFIDGDRAAFGSISVYADEDGYYYVDALSNIAQTDSVVTITSLGKTITEKVTFEGVDGNDGDSISFAAPVSSKAGRTLVVTAMLKDEYGNAVNGGTDGSTISMTYEGPGFVTEALTAASPLGTDGAYTARVLVGVGDTGPAIFTVTYDSDGAGAAEAISASSATWIGPIANATAGAKKGVVLVDIYRAKGKSYKVLVGGTVVASGVANKANFSTRVTGVKSGSRNVVVRLTDGTNFSGAITVK